MGAEGYAFYFSVPGTGKALVGYLRPSHDTIGRKYPVILASSVESRMAHSDLHDSPVIRYNTFVRDARDFVERVTGQDYNRDELNKGIEQLLQSVNLSASIPTAYSPDRISWKELSDGSGFLFEDSRKYLPFKNLKDIVFPLQNAIPSNYTLGFRFPGSNASGLRIYAASFWLAAFQKALRQPIPEQCLFWRNGEPEKDNSSLLAFLYPPPPKVIVNMLPAESESDYICDMDQIGLRKKDTASESLSDSLRKALDSSDSSLEQVIQLLD